MNPIPSSNSLYLGEKNLQALHFASIAHRDQLRLGPNNIPYISHPAAVGMILWKAGYSEDVTAAGILHDVIEDTEFSYQDIEKIFGKQIAGWVQDVSEQKSLPYRERKEQYLVHLSQSSIEAKAISAADLLANRYSMLAELAQGYRLWQKAPAWQMDHDKKRIEILKQATTIPFMPELEAVVSRVHAYFINS